MKVQIFNKAIFLLLIFFLSAFPCSSQLIDELILDYEKSLELKNRDKNIQCLNKIASYYWHNNELDDAILFYKKLLELYEKNNDKKNICLTNSNIGTLYFQNNNFSQSEEYFLKAIKLSKAINDKKIQAQLYLNLSTVRLENGMEAEAIVAAETALNISKEINCLQIIKSSYEVLYKINEKIGNTNKAYEHFQLYITYNELINKEEEKPDKPTENTNDELEETKKSLEAANRLTVEQQLKLEIQQMKSKEQKTISQEKIRHQVTITVFSLVVLVIVLLLLLLLLKQSNQTKKAHTLLKKSYYEINTQKNEIEKQSLKIKDSINYAKRIQSAVFPQPKYLEKRLKEYFVLFQPRDIISGDFYWVTHKKTITYVAVADCTGHGVPGALMSLLGISFLNEIVKTEQSEKTMSAGDILTELRSRVMKALHQKGFHDDSEDGMDVALVIIDTDNSKLQFAGANCPLYFFHEGVFKIINPDDMPVGFQNKMKEKFTTQYLDYTQNDIIYMFTDGFADQLGGTNNRKFLSSRFQNMFIQHHNYSLKIQMEKYEKILNEWKGKIIQLDDVLVMGIKL